MRHRRCGAARRGRSCISLSPTLFKRAILEMDWAIEVAMFPGMVGVEVANEISRALEELGKNRKSHHRPSREYRRRNRCASRHEPAYAGKDSVGFALPKSRVTPNLDSEKQQFRRFREFRLPRRRSVAGIPVCSSNADEVADRP